MPEAMGAPGCTPLLFGIGSGPKRTELSFEQQRSLHLASAGATDFPAFSMSMVRKHCLLLLWRDIFFWWRESWPHSLLESQQFCRVEMLCQGPPRGVGKHHASSWPRPRGRELEGFIEKGRASIGQKAFLGQGRGSFVSLSPATSRRRVQR